VIAASIRVFVWYAQQNPKLKFFVTRADYVLAGHSDKDVATFFSGVPDNCSMPEEWREYL